MSHSIFRYKIRIMILFLLCRMLNPLSAQYHYDFTYPDRDALSSDGWDFIALTASGTPRNTEQTSDAVVSYDQQIHPGVLRIPADIGDLWEGINSTRNTLFRNLPSGWTGIRLKIKSFNPDQGNQQATLVAYQDDDNYIQISRTYEVFNRIMFTSEADGHAVNLNSIQENATSNIFLRLDRDPATETITSYYSTDGIVWTETGNVIQSLRNPKLAIEVGASPSGFPDADVEWAEISTDPLPPVTDELHAQPGSIVFIASEGEETGQTRSLFVYSAMGKTIGWQQYSDVSWLTADQQNGLTDGVLRLGVKTAGLEPGLYHGNIILESNMSTSGQVIIPVSLIINPDAPVKIAVWKDDNDAAMSVSVDDAQPSGFAELSANGFKGTYVTNGTYPPSFYTAYYNAGMELGSHLVNHPCNPVSDDLLRSQEILPNLLNLSIYTPMPPEKVISLVWPCGYTNYREEAVAAEYFLSARGYNINKLEDATPENFMNLKSYNSHEHIPFPPTDLKSVVDSAVNLHKWFNLVLHNLTNDDGAITYAKSKKIWVAPIGSIIKYVLQRDRFILNGYTAGSDKCSFNVSRLSIPSSASKNFEAAFGEEDMVTVQIDIEDNRLVKNLLIDGVSYPFTIEKTDGNIILCANIFLEPDLYKSVEVNYRSEFVIPVNPSKDTLNFNTIVNRNPDNQYLSVLTKLPGAARWSSSIASSGQNWKLSINPNYGFLNDTMIISVNSIGLPVGNYRKCITITSPDEYFYPFEIEVNLDVNPNLLHQNYPNPFSGFTWIEYDLPEEGPVTLEIYNPSLQRSCSLISDYQMPGHYRLKWDSRNFPSGIYILLIRTRNFTETIKMSLIK